MLSKKRVWLVAFLAVAVLLGLRIAWVNAKAFRVPEEHYEVGDWVSVDGAFQYSFQENTDGYSVRVSKVESMSVAEYLNAYGAEGLESDREYPDVASLVVLTVDVKNEGNDSGGIYLNQCRLLSEEGAHYYYQDPTLWALSEKALYESGAPAITLAIAADSEYTVHVPYIIDDATTDLAYAHAVEAGGYELVLSWSPVINLVDVTLSEG